MIDQEKQSLLKEMEYCLIKEALETAVRFVSITPHDEAFLIRLCEARDIFTIRGR
jgi:hypothetical protein